MKKDLPKISIITPSFNQAGYIEQTICSVLDQGYPNLEYFVMDGGSTDGTVEILKKYEKHLAGWVSEKDRGQSHAINKGLARATGDVLAYINSDDWYLPGIFSAVGAHFSVYGGARLLHGRCVFTDQDGARQKEHFAGIQTVADMLNLRGFWWNHKNFVQPEVFWSRQMAKQTGAFSESLYYCMDYEYWLRALVAGAKVDAMEMDFACFRRHGQQKTSQAAKSNMELMGVVGQALWRPSTPLDSAVRHQLKQQWLEDGPVNDFRNLADQSAIQGDGRLVRWRKLLGFIARHPRVLQAEVMRLRLGRFAGGG